VIFGPAPLNDELIGAIVAHNLKTTDRVIAKGAILDAETIALLHRAGHRTITAARLAANDVPEAEAAAALGRHIAGPFLRITAPVHGRVNVFAEIAGLLAIDRSGVAALNLLDEGITLGTLADAVPVAPGTMLATLKIIPFAIPDHLIQTAAALLDRRPLITILPFRPLAVGLILSRLPHLKDSTIRTTIEATSRRITARGGRLLAPIETSHATAPIADAITRLSTAGADLILIAGASAVTDRADIAPAAIVAAGGRIERFGMPVDPGNLLCFGRIDTTPAVILPGCARSPKLNGIDFVLDRVFAGSPIDDATIAGLGVGGLLKDFTPRPSPRIPRPRPKSAPRIAAIILAAGTSSRAAPDHKLLVRTPDGRTLIAITADHVLASRAAETIVVLGHRADDIRTAIGNRPVRFVESPRYHDGMAESLKAGIAALPEDIDAALICLGDMPLVDAAALDRIIAAYDPDEGRAIIIPTHRGRRGNPILWDRRFFPEIAALSGDTGARPILAAHLDAITELPMPDDATLRDFDTTDALAALKDAL